MHEVVQHAKVEVHADLVEHRFQPGVERFAVLGTTKAARIARRLLAGSGALPGAKS